MVDLGASKVVEGVFEETRGALARHGAGLAAEALASGLRRRLGQASQEVTFTVGATGLIAATAAVAGGVAGWKLNEWLSGRRRR